VKYRRLVEKLLSKPILKPHEGKGSDPAHPAIYPTGNLPEKPLTVSSRRIFDLIVRRYLAVFSVPAIKQGMSVSINVDGELLYLHGRRVLEKGWLMFYEPYVKSDEVILPTIEAGQRILLRDVRLEERYTPPPARYNPNSLLNMMGDQGIGTKATRASIIDTLYKRGYVQGTRMEATGLGFRVVEALGAFCPGILSVELTKELEGEMARIEEGVLKQEEVLERVVNVLKDVLLDFKDNEELIGRALSDALDEVRRDASVVGTCPVCGSGSLMILRSRKTGKRFVGCSNFRRGLCDTSSPLPQPPYTVKPVSSSCNKCGWPRVQVKSRSKQPWYLCLNPDCPTKSRRRGRR
jgi:DNA topoisomerase-1